MALGRYVIGIDFGTDSVRAVIVDALSGDQLGTGISTYKRWAEGLYCNPLINQFRQHPLDYIESLTESVREALAGIDPSITEKVEAISVDTTCSTPCLVDKSGTPLSLLPEFSDDPDAMFILWKDHTSIKQAEQINELSRSREGVDYTRYLGGVYSSEWFWAKALRVFQTNEKISSRTDSIVEHSDWIPAILTGVNDHKHIFRNRGAAGHKAMWHPSWGGFPSPDFFSALHPKLGDIVRELPHETYTSIVPVGTLCPEWADRLGLSKKVIVTAGIMDAQSGAIGGNIKPGTMLKIMGTSTCDLLIGSLAGEPDNPVSGICGQVDGSSVPGWICYEAGQSAYGDIFAWFRDLLMWPSIHIQGIHSDAGVEKTILSVLDAEAAKISPSESGILAIDWLNGRRTPFADQNLKGAITGLTLGSTAPMVYRALVEAAAFGSRAINERFIQEGIPVNDIIAVGGVARKSPFVMQLNADVLGMKTWVSASDQSGALGAAMCASVAAGIYHDVPAAQDAMGEGIDTTYVPNPERKEIYDKLYRRYLELGSFVEKSFGTRK